MKHYYGVRALKLENSPYGLDVILYDTLDTVQQNTPLHIFDGGIPPLAVINHHLFTSLRGVFLAEPGDHLHMKDGSVISIFTYVVMIDQYFFTELSFEELDALIQREEVLFRHIQDTGDKEALKNLHEYYITHDTLTCMRGVKAQHLRRALWKSKRFECGVTARLFKMDALDRFSLKLMYTLQRFNTHNRLRNKNLKQLQSKPPLHIVNNRVLLGASKRKVGEK